MKILFIVLLSLFVAATAALFIAHNPGYVLIAREPLVIETSLAVFVMVMVLLFIALYGVARFALRLVHAPRDLARWRQARRTRKSRDAFHHGLIHLLGGEWLKAEQSLLASLHASDSPFLGTLAVALAAHGQHDLAKRDRYLALAHAQAGADAPAAELLQARLQMAGSEIEPAHATLARLRDRAPNQAEITRLLLKAYRELHDWQAVLRLIPDVRRRRVLPETELADHELAAHQALLSLDLPKGALDTLRTAWHAIPKPLHNRPELVAAYARQLVKQDAADEAITLLAATLENHWSDTLVQLYGEAVSNQPAVQLEYAEEWLAHRGDSATLLLAAGRLARRAGQADRAQNYLERSLRLGAGAAAHAELAQLLEARGDRDRALDHYRAAADAVRKMAAGTAPTPAAAPGAESMQLDISRGY